MCSRYAPARFPLSTGFSVLLLLLVAPRPAAAQIEVGESGHVGIGTAPPGAARLRVEGLTSGWATANFRATRSNGGNYAAAAIARNGNQAKGLWAAATGATEQNISVYAKAAGGAHNYGIHVRAGSGGFANYAGYFGGDVHVTGNLTEASDQKFKRGIQPLGTGPTANAPGDDPRAKLLQLQPRAYQYRRSDYPGMGFPEGKQFGLVAQQVEEVFPALVSTERRPGIEEVDEDGNVTQTREPMTYKSVNYIQLVPLLIQTAKEQQTEIDALQEELSTLKQALQQQGIQVE